MKIHTGNFANLKKYKEAGLFPVSIALSSRYFTGITYKPLNPDRSFLNDHEDIYTPKFNKILQSLSASKVLEDLKMISNGQDIVLLCHESENEFCHRRLVAKWLEKHLKIEVKELGKMKSESQIAVTQNLF